jgi:hypothetical protein
MSHARPRLQAAAMFGAVLLAVQAAVAQPVAKSFAHTLKARGIAEECFRLPADAAVGYAFEATGPVDFNIHFHRGTDVEYPVKSDQIRQAEARFVAPSAQEYCLMWTNRTAAPLAVNGTLTP